RIAADDVGIGDAAVGQRHLDGFGTADDVVVGKDVAVGADDHARAQRAFDGLFQAAVVFQVPAQQRVLELREAQRVDAPRRVDVDHRGCGGGDRGTEGVVAAGALA